MTRDWTSNSDLPGSPGKVPGFHAPSLGSRPTEYDVYEGIPLISSQTSPATITHVEDFHSMNDFLWMHQVLAAEYEPDAALDASLEGMKELPIFDTIHDRIGNEDITSRSHIFPTIRTAEPTLVASSSRQSMPHDSQQCSRK
ncbi:hypothetical protein N7532_006014 [Penicillium argentinense]|uniref:Uncharacterized protein n=1 Tax=Penicillium argentinense TaxID=1131581 RepID=A0A9W9KAH7_9EURO|nr:uncharacterized protein N7532_006014 [Penicillium argentinense]KAJ5099013.1 hypothetical protein N7532_006014 [Penicillium argentinense]